MGKIDLRVVYVRQLHNAAEMVGGATKRYWQLLRSENGQQATEQA